MMKKVDDVGTILDVVVVGGGGAGLCSARYLLEEPSRYRCTLYEQTESVGGTWAYTDRVGSDRYGNTVHSCMYKSLRTNLPKEAMEFPGFHFRENPLSYVHWEKVLEYLKDYADEYNLWPCIKANHRVDRITRHDEKWDVTITNLESNTTFEQTYDVVMIGNGHLTDPKYPDIEGMDTFDGYQIHSRDYRIPEPFSGKDILIIGAGPSGLDLACEICRFSNKVFLSHHSSKVVGNKFPDNIIQKTDICKIDGKRIFFKDGTQAVVDSIIYCTGYNYTYPFLDKTCGITVEENYVTPLYKHVININHPSMCIIGIPRLSPQFPMFDLQVRFYLSYLKNEFITKEEMLKDLEEFEKQKTEENSPRDCFHALKQYNYFYYFDELVEAAGVHPIPYILFKMHNHASKNIFSDFVNFRKNTYRVINRECFRFNDTEVQ